MIARSENMFPPEIIAEFQLLMQLQWQFLGYSWPSVTKTKYHRSEIKEVNEISFIKSYVLERLGYIPVFSSWSSCLVPRNILVRIVT